MDERRETVLDLLVDEVRLDAAAARCVPFFELLEPARDEPLFDALRVADLVPPRLDERADEPDFDERAEDFAPDFVPDRDEDFAEDLEVFAPDFAADLEPDFAADLVDLPEDFEPDFVPDFEALLLPEDLPEDFVDLDALFEPDFVPDFEPDLEVLFAAVFEPPFLAPDFVPLFLAPVAPLLRDEPLRERLLLLDVELPPDEPPELDSFCMVSDLSSVAITASLQGPSRENRHA